MITEVGLYSDLASSLKTINSCLPLKCFTENKIGHIFNNSNMFSFCVCEGMIINRVRNEQSTAEPSIIFRRLR